MLTFDYAMELDFGGGKAQEHSFTLRCVPQEEPSQHIEHLNISLFPRVPLSYGRDAFGNRYCFGIIHNSHGSFSVRVTGKVKHLNTSAAAPVKDQIIYRQQTGITKPGPAIQKLYSDMGTPLSDSYLQAVKIRETVHSYMEYVPNSTNSLTTAEEAASMGKGVCQDYAHIMLSLCRMYGIPCRYTAGLLTGEGQSHAWVEVCSDKGLWRTLDPTNPDSGNDEKLIFSHGRDASDCEINRGVYTGPDTQIQHVNALLIKSEKDPGNKTHIRKGVSEE